jgi:uncharacterized protein involved in response to NO
MGLRTFILYFGFLAAVVALVDLFFYKVFSFHPVTVGGIIGGVIAMMLRDSLTGDLPKDKKPVEGQDNN